MEKENRISFTAEEAKNAFIANMEKEPFVQKMMNLLRKGFKKCTIVDIPYCINDDEQKPDYIIIKNYLTILGYKVNVLEGGVFDYNDEVYAAEKDLKTIDLCVSCVENDIVDECDPIYVWKLKYACEYKFIGNRSCPCSALIPNAEFAKFKRTRIGSIEDLKYHDCKKCIATIPFKEKIFIGVVELERNGKADVSVVLFQGRLVKKDFSSKDVVYFEYNQDIVDNLHLSYLPPF